MTNDPVSRKSSPHSNTALATKVPFDIGPIHFVGIGGIGMSGIAEVPVSYTHLTLPTICSV